MKRQQPLMKKETIYQYTEWYILALESDKMIGIEVKVRFNKNKLTI